MYAWMRGWVPGRHRALLGEAMQTRRSAPQSQCDRQVTQLLLILRDAGPMRFEDCVKVLNGDSGEEWLTRGRSHALVDATLREALVRAWCDPRTPLERELMRPVVDRLEALEAYIAREYPVKDDGSEKTLERELLLHMGRGVELLRWDEKKARIKG
jgi:hypothetical protein